MAFSDVERAEIRRYMAVSPINLASEDPVGQSMLAVENLNDNAASEGLVRAELAKLAVVEAKADEMQTLLEVGKSDDTTLDAARGIAAALMEGRRHVGNIATVLDYVPRRDVFSPVFA